MHLSLFEDALDESHPNRRHIRRLKHTQVYFDALDSICTMLCLGLLEQLWDTNKFTQNKGSGARKFRENSLTLKIFANVEEIGIIWRSNRPKIDKYLTPDTFKREIFVKHPDAVEIAWKRVVVKEWYKQSPHGARSSDVSTQVLCLFLDTTKNPDCLGLFNSKDHMLEYRDYFLDEKHWRGGKEGFPHSAQAKTMCKLLKTTFKKWCRHFRAPGDDRKDSEPDTESEVEEATEQESNTKSNRKREQE